MNDFSIQRYFDYVCRDNVLTVKICANRSSDVLELKRCIDLCDQGAGQSVNELKFRIKRNTVHITEKGFSKVCTRMKNL